MLLQLVTYIANLPFFSKISCLWEGGGSKHLKKKKSALRKAHIFWQLVANFADFQRNNRVFIQN